MCVSDHDFPSIKSFLFGVVCLVCAFCPTVVLLSLRVSCTLLRVVALILKLLSFSLLSLLFSPLHSSYLIVDPAFPFVRCEPERRPSLPFISLLSVILSFSTIVSLLVLHCIRPFAVQALFPPLHATLEPFYRMLEPLHRMSACLVLLEASVILLAEQQYLDLVSTIIIVRMAASTRICSVLLVTIALMVFLLLFLVLLVFIRTSRVSLPVRPVLLVTTVLDMA